MNKTSPITGLDWKTSKVFELSVERQGLEFTPGDSIAIFSADGSESRPYSIASGHDDPTLRFLIQRMPGGTVSEYLSKLKIGDSIQISAPFGWFRPGKFIHHKPCIYIATGTGIAPFLSCIRAFPHSPPNFLLYGVRKLEDAIDLEFLQTSCSIQLTLSQERVLPYLYGRVTDHLPIMKFEPDTQFFLCGLDAMIDDVSRWLENSGVPFSHIHREVFFHVSP